MQKQQIFSTMYTVTLRIHPAKHNSRGLLQCFKVTWCLAVMSLRWTRCIVESHCYTAGHPFSWFWIHVEPFKAWKRDNDSVFFWCSWLLWKITFVIKMCLALLGHPRKDTIWLTFETRAWDENWSTAQQDDIYKKKTKKQQHMEWIEYWTILTFTATFKLLRDMFVQHKCCTQ